MKHTCKKCFCNTKIKIPKCCLYSKHYCNKCKQSYENEEIFRINENSKILKCSKTALTHLYPADVYVSYSNIPNIGLGVFANRKFAKFEIIEIAPYIMIDMTNTNTPILHSYVFYINEQKIAALSLGFGSLYNHSNDANTNYIVDEQLQRLMVFYANRDIDAHEELYIDYGYSPKNDLSDPNNQLSFHDNVDFDISQNDISEEFITLTKKLKHLCI